MQMVRQSVATHGCRATWRLKMASTAVKTTRNVIVCHRVQRFHTTPMFRRMTSILFAPYGNQDITGNSIWRSDYAIKNFSFAQEALFLILMCFSRFRFSSTFSRIVVSFKDEDFNTFTRVEKYTWIDILSSVGGFCGLLVGASLLSVIELLYYFTLRIFFALRKRHESDGDAADNNHNDRDRVIYVSPATLRHLSNRSRTLDQTQPFTFVQRIRWKSIGLQSWRWTMFVRSSTEFSDVIFVHLFIHRHICENSCYFVCFFLFVSQ